MMKNTTILFIVFNMVCLSNNAISIRHRVKQVPDAGQDEYYAKNVQLAEQQAVQWFLVHAARWGNKQDMRDAIKRMRSYTEKYQENERQFITELDDKGFTLLHWAAKYNSNVEVIKELLGVGASAKALDAKGQAPWQLAPEESTVRQYLHDATYWPDLD